MLVSIQPHPDRRIMVLARESGHTSEGVTGMSQFLILIYDDENAWMNAAPGVAQKLMDDHNAFGQKYGEAILGGNALESVTTATTLRRDGSDKFAVTDGPFVETKEALGGYYLVEAADLDAAIDMARDVPVLQGGLEVRPIMVFN